MISRVVEALPSGVDLLLPADASGLGTALAGYRPDLLVVYGFNWILPRAVFDLPTYGTVNVHPSALPRYRGPAPVLWAIRNGDTEIGVTVHRVDGGVDTGPVLARRTGVPLAEEVTRDSLRDDLAPVIADVLAEALARVAGGAEGEPQPTTGVSHAGFLEPEFVRVDWSGRARDIHNQVRVFRFLGKPHLPVGRVDGRWLAIRRTSLVPAGGARVECGDGPLWILDSAPADPPDLPA
jgi:methionyl-tRNA formyltransferase